MTGSEVQPHEETREEKKARKKLEKKKKMGRLKDACRCDIVMYLLLAEIVLAFIFMIVAAASLKGDLWNQH